MICDLCKTVSAEGNWKFGLKDLAISSGKTGISTKYPLEGKDYFHASNCDTHNAYHQVTKFLCAFYKPKQCRPWLRGHQRWKRRGKGRNRMVRYAISCPPFALIDINPLFQLLMQVRPLALTWASATEVLKSREFPKTRRRSMTFPIIESLMFSEFFYLLIYNDFLLFSYPTGKKRHKHKHFDKTFFPYYLVPS